jgi:hypothetical protein
MISAIYVGPSPRLEGERALIMDDPDDPNAVFAQFDRNPLYIGDKNLASGWHPFFRRHFNVEGNQLPPCTVGTTPTKTWTDEALDEKGLWMCGGSIRVRCCSCGQIVDFLHDPENWSSSDDYYCGRSPRCCP